MSKGRNRCLPIGIVVFIVFLLWNSSTVILPNASTEPFRGGEEGDLVMGQGDSLYFFRCPLRLRVYNILDVGAIVESTRRQSAERLDAAGSSGGSLMGNIRAMGEESATLVREYRRKYSFLNERYLLFQVRQGQLPRLLVRCSRVPAFGIAYRQELRVYVITAAYVLVWVGSLALIAIGIKRTRSALPGERSGT
jgi:hypothetical protein